MPQRDGATEPDGSMSSTGWGTVTVVQSKLSTGKPGVDLDQPTTPGTLLVVMCPDPKPPTPQGLAPNWQMLKSSYGAAIAIWPDHPGGIRHFTINDTNNNLFFVEMSGVPADVQLSGLVDTGPKAGGTTMEALMGAPVAGPHGIGLLYIDTTSGTSAASDMGWTALGTDGNNDFGWYWLNPTTPFGARVTFSPTSPAAMMMVLVANGK